MAKNDHKADAESEFLDSSRPVVYVGHLKSDVSGNVVYLTEEERLKRVWMRFCSGDPTARKWLEDYAARVQTKSHGPGGLDDRLLRR